MNRLLVGAMALALGAVPAAAQSLGDSSLQIHGFATQAIVFSNDNNYLAMDTSAGSTAWTEAAVNVNDKVSDKLRVGVQFHYTRLGSFGGDTLNVDWAVGDYKLNPWMGVRAGKVKIRWGLFNDTQDYDPGYLWSLLPETVYAVDFRATNLSQLGAEIYGKVPVGKALGKLKYSVYYGDYFFASDDGYMEGLKASGLSFTNKPWGKTPGFDLRWEAPVQGLTLGGSLMMYDATGNLTDGKFSQPLTYWPTYFAQYSKDKLFASAQYVKLVQYQTIAQADAIPETGVVDSRSWFAMGGYHLSEKLQAGAYYTRYVNASAANDADPANHFHDWVASGRYDFDANFYCKLEGHFIDGNGVGFYSFNNPDDLKPKTKLMVAKIGFTF